MTDARPTLFHFNPTCEIAIANGSPYFTPSNLLRQFEDDLAPLMLHFAKANDLVVAPTPPEQWIERMHEAGFTIPRFASIDQLKAERLADDTLKLECWGNSPAESHRFQFLEAGNRPWKDSYRTVFERKTAVGFLHQLLQAEVLPSCIDRQIAPHIVRSEAEIARLLNSSAPLVLKTPLSSSGRGLAVLRRNKLNESNRQWIKGNLEQQGYLTAEPWLDKQLDLSLQFRIESAGKVRYLTPSFFETNSNGQYSGHFLNFSDWARIPGGQESLRKLSSLMHRELENSVYSKNYSGPLGIDLISYRDENGQLMIHPCLEINPRYTMGYLSTKLEAKIHPEAKGHFKIHFAPQGTMVQVVEQKREANPLQMLDGRPRKGFLELTPVNSSSKFCAYLTLF
ncbi:hypothetical protein [Mangrovibacterium marinum]|uniref:ATP-grasp domain-containing protein n=1 Tax=Mangrovibacterium marinum TaxID=1639118 RepID=A0A2T5C391_9BACT|nr:hypothetical protein [Mangrovibacterium marinum]PTN09228.1 hypothetical protein C8N47_10568 [Mangrovibacterium marinum]